MSVVGRVAAIWRYPVKSMAAEAMENADLRFSGFTGDRRWAFVREALMHQGFPWFTLRQNNNLNDYRPRLSESGVTVTAPSGKEFEITDPLLAAEIGQGEAIRAMKQNTGIFDTMPVSVLSTKTVATLSSLVGRELHPLRFRPNVLVEAEVPEDAWVGSCLRVGETVIRVDARDKRCVVVNVDPVTGERDPEVLRHVAASFDMCLGVYGSTVLPGQIAVGDPVEIG